MKNGNQLLIQGRLTGDANFVASQNGSGKQKITFSICWNKPITNQETGERDTEAHFFDCETWFLTKAQFEYLKPRLVKGAPIAILDAHIEKQVWTTNEGQRREKAVIMVDDAIGGIVLIDSGKSQEKPVQDAPAPTSNVTAETATPQVSTPAPAPVESTPVVEPQAPAPAVAPAHANVPTPNPATPQANPNLAEVASEIITPQNSAETVPTADEDAYGEDIDF